MSERFDLRPLIRGLSDGLRNRRADAEMEVPDVWSRIVLFGIPALILVLMVAFRVELTHADQLLAGAALLSAALIGAFAQIVTWRERILRRNREVERVKVRALNEAGAHVLVSLVMSVVVTAAVFVLANLNLTCVSLYVHLIAWILSATSAACFAYVALSLIIVANLLWDAFEREEQDIAEQNSSQYPPNDSC
ncbi:hypothetical protein ACX80N_09555 [Arthrobacter sp. MDT2-16]